MLDRYGPRERLAYGIDLDGLARRLTGVTYPLPLFKLASVCCTYAPESRPSFADVSALLAEIAKKL